MIKKIFQSLTGNIWWFIINMKQLKSGQYLCLSFNNYYGYDKLNYHN